MYVCTAGADLSQGHRICDFRKYRKKPRNPKPQVTTRDCHYASRSFRLMSVVGFVYMDREPAAFYVTRMRKFVCTPVKITNFSMF